MGYNKKTPIEKLQILIAQARAEKDSQELKSIESKFKNMTEFSFEGFLETLSPAETKVLSFVVNPVDRTTGFRADSSHQTVQSVRDLSNPEKMSRAINTTFAVMGNKKSVTVAKNSEMTTESVKSKTNFANASRPRKKATSKNIMRVVSVTALSLAVAAGTFLGISNRNLRAENSNLQSSIVEKDSAYDRLQGDKDKLQGKYDALDQDWQNKYNTDTSKIDKDWQQKYDAVSSENKAVRDLLATYGTLNENESLTDMIKRLYANMDSSKTQEVNQAYANIVKMLSDNGLTLNDIYNSTTGEYDLGKLNNQLASQLGGLFKTASDYSKIEELVSAGLDFVQIPVKDEKGNYRYKTIEDYSTLSEAVEDYMNNIESAVNRETVKNLNQALADAKTGKELSDFDSIQDAIKYLGQYGGEYYDNFNKKEEENKKLISENEILKEQLKVANENSMTNNGNQQTSGSVNKEEENLPVSGEDGKDEDAPIEDEKPDPSKDENNHGTGSGSSGSNAGSNEQEKEESNFGRG